MSLLALHFALAIRSKPVSPVLVTVLLAATRPAQAGNRQDIGPKKQSSTLDSNPASCRQTNWRRDTELYELPNPWLSLPLPTSADTAAASFAPASPGDVAADNFPRGFDADKFLAELELVMDDRPAFLRAPSPEYVEATIRSAIGGW
jgi:hypothetical protein